MQKLFLVILLLFIRICVFGQPVQVGKGVFPENQVFGFTLTPDKKTAFFVKSFGGRDTMLIYSSDFKNGRWQKPKPTSFTSKPGVAKDIDPFVSPDGKQLFFQSNRGLKKGDKNQKHFDLWVTHRTAKGWGEPEHLGAAVNSDSSESFMSATRSGKIYFGSNRAGGFGKLDIYSSVYADGVYQEPVNIGMQINSTDHESNPFIAADESYMILSLTSGKPNNDSDLFITFNQNGKWTKPWNLGPEINSYTNEFCPFVLPGEDTLYFARLEKSKRFKENIYKVHLPIEQLKRMISYQAMIFQDGVISTGDVLSSTFEPDGKTVYFVRSIPDRSVAKIYKSTQIGDEQWSEPELVPFSMIDPFTVTPFVTRDGSKMIFSANLNNMDLWVVNKTAIGWGKPYPVRGPVNSAKDDYFPSMSDNGTLYFASSRGLGGGDLFRSRLVNGVYQEPEALTDLNTSAAESNPLIAPDESYLIFMALRPEGFGDYDLYISYQLNGKWSAPQNLGPAINTDVKDFQPSLSPDGKYFYFSRTSWPPGSSKRYGEENIYRIDIRALPLKR